MKSIILAAGKGTRLHSAEHDCPKVMHTINGKPLLEIALGLVDFIDKKDITIVVGYKKEQIIDTFGDKYNYVEQKEQLGTGHAVSMCAELFENYDGNVIVTYGDMPLYRKQSLKNLCDYHEKVGADCTVMSAYNPNLPTYGRIVRNRCGNFKGIIEAKDCTEEQLKITECNSGVAVFNSKSLFKVLPLLQSNNKQNEYYLTDVPALMMSKKMKVDVFAIEDGEEILGVNTPEELIACEEILNKRNDI